MLNTYNIQLNFDESIIKVIYDEGVYPTQGTRPLFSTIQQVIVAKLPSIMSKLVIAEVDTNKLLFSYINNEIEIKCLKDEETIYRITEQHEFDLQKLRVNKQDEMQAITAVHESGHAVLSIALLNVVPNIAYSITADNDSEGFIFTKIPWEFVPKNEIVPRLAMMLGGYAAEQLIFGAEHQTAGSNSDIERATNFVSQMFKNHGLADDPITYATTSKAPEEKIHCIKDIEDKMHQAMLSALELARETLKREMRLLLEFSDFLSNHTLLEKDKML